VNSLEADNVPLAILIGLISTTQLHLAKALERQGIEVFDQLRARIKQTGNYVEGDVKKPIIYTFGVVLNNTIFIYAIIAQRYAPPAIYTSMFGVGLIFLMLYAWKVLGERITLRHALGSVAIIIGTLVLGVENILHQDVDRFDMSLTPTFILVAAFLTLGALAMISTARTHRSHLIASVFGIFCGGYGSLDPFLKGIAQNIQGQPEWIPGSWQGWAVFLPSFMIGFLSFALTQVAFAKKAPASVFVTFYNASYILLPVVLQVILLPTYKLYWSTCIGIASIILGIALMRSVIH
jgi:drug/metabolite transporter (DMT)-like permease